MAGLGLVGRTSDLEYIEYYKRRKREREDRPGKRSLMPGRAVCGDVGEALVTLGAVVMGMAGGRAEEGRLEKLCVGRGSGMRGRVEGGRALSGERWRCGVEGESVCAGEGESGSGCGEAGRGESEDEREGEGGGEGESEGEGIERDSAMDSQLQRRVMQLMSQPEFKYASQLRQSHRTQTLLTAQQTTTSLGRNNKKEKRKKKKSGGCGRRRR